jgi:hypothetical protein
MCLQARKWQSDLTQWTRSKATVVVCFTSLSFVGFQLLIIMRGLFKAQQSLLPSAGRHGQVLGLIAGDDDARLDSRSGTPKLPDKWT